MAPVKVLPLLGATLCVLGKTAPGEGAQPGPNATYTVKLGSEGACLSEINNVREAAGLSKFVQASEPDKKIPAYDDDGKQTWESFCKDVLRAGKNGSKASISGDDDGDGAMHSMMVIESEKVNCQSVVDRWKEAYKGFSGMPPAPVQSSGLYERPDIVMFVSLFTPSSAATADCRVVTCTETTTLTDPKQNSETRGYAFFCKTVPNALGEGGTPPFTKEQWEKIASILKASSPAVVPSFSFVLLAAVGGVLL